MESLSIQDNSGDSIFESEPVSIDQVKQMKTASEKLYCRLSDNKVITFGHYMIKDYDSKEVLVEINEEMQGAVHMLALAQEEAGVVTLDDRTIQYSFGSKFLEYKTLSLKLEFNIVTDEPVKDLLLVERHYFRDRLLINFEFKFPFCMPNSKNDCEFIYDLP